MPAPFILDYVGVRMPDYRFAFADWCDLCDAADNYVSAHDRISKTVEEWVGYDNEEEFE